MKKVNVLEGKNYEAALAGSGDGISELYNEAAPKFREEAPKIKTKASLGKLNRESREGLAAVKKLFLLHNVDSEYKKALKIVHKKVIALT